MGVKAMSISKLIPFADAKYAVLDFTGHLAEKRIPDADVSKPDGSAFENSGLRSRRGLTYSQAYLVDAFWSYIIQEVDDKAVQEALWILLNYVPFVVPDHIDEPLTFEEWEVVYEFAHLLAKKISLSSQEKILLRNEYQAAKV
jgi:hypothetical protein